MKMLMSAAICLFCALAFASSPVEFKPGERFMVAAAKLRKAGWQPDPKAHADTGEYFGTDRILVMHGYPEVDFCSVDTASCIHQYVKGASCLRLQTKGEQIERMRVVSVSNLCREAHPSELDTLPGDVRFLVQWQMECDKFDHCAGLTAYRATLLKKYAKNKEISGFIDGIE